MTAPTVSSLENCAPVGDPSPAGAAFSGLGLYDAILADPPWRFALRSRKNLVKAPDAHYSTMPLADIKALPVQDICKPDCLIFLWATAPMMPQALDLLTAWGFEYSTMGAWPKTTKHGKAAFGTGYRYRSSVEPWLVGTKGNPPLGLRNVRNRIDGTVREHSRKPDCQYAHVEALTPWADHRVELFSRTSVPGWDAWGDESGRFSA